MCRSSLEMIVGLESNSKIFTVAVQGLLELQVSHRRLGRGRVRCITCVRVPPQAGQYTSIFVDNAAGAPITIQNGSDFMGMLLGA